jgi:CubicO group peptidase (beta-lactamase class C family)
MTGRFNPTGPETMKCLTLRTVLCGFLLVSLFCGRAAAQDRFPGAEWDHVAPAQYGWSEAGLASAKDWSQQQVRSTAVMIIHHGAVVAEWGDTAKRAELASIRKSLLSALIGQAVTQHKIDLDRTVGQLGIDDNAPSLTDGEKQATVQMLLEARSGIYHPALYETPGMAAARPPRGSHPPGTFWYYNNWDFNALGAIYEQAAGIGIYDAIARFIAQPIGMQDYRPSDGHYVTGADSLIRAYPLRMSARDLARFALLYLHHGTWAGQQIVPGDWVKDSTQAYSTSHDGFGYGYLWWIAGTGPARIALPPGSFFAWGAGGQFAFVIPADDLVIVNQVDRDRHLPQPALRDVSEMVRLIRSAEPAIH